MTQHQLSTCGTSAFYIILFSIGEGYPLRVLLRSEGTAGEADNRTHMFIK